jgi:hypothetical protein
LKTDDLPAIASDVCPDKLHGNPSRLPASSSAHSGSSGKEEKDDVTFKKDAKFIGNKPPSTVGACDASKGSPSKRKHDEIVTIGDDDDTEDVLEATQSVWLFFSPLKFFQFLVH